MVQVQLFLFSSLMLLQSCQPPAATEGLEQQVGGPCDGCELMLKGMPESISWETTLCDGSEPGGPMTISGTIFKSDGKTPAPGVIMYLYQTDNTGRYTPHKEQQDGRRHGHLRGWVKSNDQGRYQFRSIRPGAYPDRSDPQHVHAFIKEPGLGIYWIDNFEFVDDPLLTEEYRNSLPQRGGSGVMELSKGPGGWEGERDLVLGLNIPDHPAEQR